MRLILPALLVLGASTASAERIAIDNSNCGIIDGQLRGSVNSYGFLDYIDPAAQSEIAKAGRAYFPPRVEQMQSSGTKMGNTKILRISPNHHRALYSMMRFFRSKPHPSELKEFYNPDCMFKRANAMNPNDATVYMLHGMFYHWESDWKKSEEQYLLAYKLRPNDPQINYNLGLMYYDKGEYENSAQYARIAYDKGYPLQGLSKKLKKVNISVN